MLDFFDNTRYSSYLVVSLKRQELSRPITHQVMENNRRVLGNTRLVISVF